MKKERNQEQEQPFLGKYIKVKAWAGFITNQNKPCRYRVYYRVLYYAQIGENIFSTIKDGQDSGHVNGQMGKRKA